MRGTYTFGSDEGVAAVLAALPDHYDMSLNPGDMTTVFDALMCKWESLDEGDDPEGRVVGLLSTIAERVGVEWV